MKLIFLNGPPAVGKYTIAKELETRIGCGIFHNHLTIDAARPIFEFGSENFWKLVYELRLTCIRAAAKNCDGILVYTSCYDHPNDLSFFEEIEETMHSSGAELLPVYLRCEVSELEKRVMSDSRKSMRKVRSMEGLHKNLDRWNCVAVPRNNCVTVTTDEKTPSECAREIIDLLRLSR
jgi:chloramphenicol 3-O-phosphotransferase